MLARDGFRRCVLVSDDHGQSFAFGSILSQYFLWQRISQSESDEVRGLVCCPVREICTASFLYWSHADSLSARPAGRHRRDADATTMLRLQNFIAALGDVFGGVASIDDHLCMPHDKVVVVGGVIGGDHDDIVFLQIGGSEGNALFLEVVFALFMRGGDVRVVVIDFRAAVFELFDEDDGR